MTLTPPPPAPPPPRGTLVPRWGEKNDKKMSEGDPWEILEASQNTGVDWCMPASIWETKRRRQTERQIGTRYSYRKIGEHTHTGVDRGMRASTWKGRRRDRDMGKGRWTQAIKVQIGRNTYTYIDICSYTPKQDIQTEKQERERLRERHTDRYL